MSRNLPIFLAVLLIAVLAGFPAFNGYLFKKTLSEYIMMINSSADGAFTLQVKEYKQGWMHSYAELEISSPNLAYATLNGTIIKNDIQHGPIIYDKDTKKYLTTFNLVRSVVLPSPQLAKTITNYNNKPIFFIKSIVGFDNSISQGVVSKPLSTQETDNGIVVTNSMGSMELTNNIILEPNQIKFKGIGTIHGNATGIYAKEKPITIISADPYTYNYDCTLSRTNLSQCFVNLNMPKIRENGGKKDRLLIEDTSASVVARVDPDQKLYYDYETKIANIKYANNSIANDLQFKASIGKLSFDKILQVIAIAKQSPANEKLTPEQQQQASQLMMQIFNQGSHFNISLVMDNDSGKISINNTLKLTQAITMENAHNLKQLLDESLSVTIPSSYLEYLLKSGLVVMNVCLPDMMRGLMQGDNAPDPEVLESQCMNNIAKYTQIKPIVISDKATGAPTVNNSEEELRKQILKNVLTAVNTWQQDGFIVSSGSNYTFNLTMKDGSVLINNQPRDYTKWQQSLNQLAVVGDGDQVQSNQAQMGASMPVSTAMPQSQEMRSGPLPSSVSPDLHDANPKVYEQVDKYLAAINQYAIYPNNFMREGLEPKPSISKSSFTMNNKTTVEVTLSSVPTQVCQLLIPALNKAPKFTVNTKQTNCANMEITYSFTFIRTAETQALETNDIKKALLEIEQEEDPTRLSFTMHLPFPWFSSTDIKKENNVIVVQMSRIPKRFYAEVLELVKSNSKNKLLKNSCNENQKCEISYSFGAKEVSQNEQQMLPTSASSRPIEMMAQ